MDVGQITQLIATVGFPIVACLLMGWYVKYREDKNSQLIKEMNETHRKEIEEVTQAVNNNTLALQRLCDKME